MTPVSVSVTGFFAIPTEILTYNDDYVCDGFCKSLFTNAMVDDKKRKEQEHRTAGETA